MDMVTRLAALRAWALALVLVSTTAVADRPVYCSTERWRSLIGEAAARFEIPQAWLHAVIRAESSGCESIDGHPITSAAGAMGLMQLMPATWDELRGRLALGNDPYNPRDNIFAGAAYLRELYDRYGSPGFLAAYHAGPERYEAYRLGESSLPAATLEYLRRISPESRITATVPTIVASANPRPIGDLFILLKHTDLREDHAAKEWRKAPPDARSE